MTNGEKFKEIFGFDLNTENMHCISEGSCKDCPLAFTKALTRSKKTGEEIRTYQYKYPECTDFWDDEYIKHDCTNCQHGDTDDTELPCRECGVGPDNKWSPIDKIDSLAKRITDMERCMDNYDNILKFHDRKIDHLNNLINGLYGVNAPEPMFHVDLSLDEIRKQFEEDLKNGNK